MQNCTRLTATALAVALIAFAGPAASVSAASPHGSVTMAVVNVVATADQKFSPDHIVLHVGKRQTLHFTSSGGVHGIESKDLGIPSTMIMPGKPISVNVTPKTAGSYKIPCSIVCGPGHADMLLTVQVKP